MTLSIQEDFSLEGMNTFGLPARARYFCVVDSVDMLQEALRFAKSKSLGIFILGGGSNLVLLDDLKLLVISIKLKGVTYRGKHVKVMAGENWHSFVRQMINEGRYGLENLSYIPGQVGAAPVQNIGAYGVELSGRVISVETINRLSGETLTLTKDECAFSYRDSVFKNDLKNKLVIVSITLALDEKYTPILDYLDLQRHFEGNENPSALEVSDALIEIRSKKLPDPKQIGNAGSFFKNPILDKEAYQTLCKRLDLSSVNQHLSDKVKVSAALLISRAGLQGKQIGGAAVSEQHALVIVNKDKAKGENVLALAAYIQAEISRQYNIDLQVEPEFIKSGL